MNEYRKPAVAGLFYPANAKQLSDEVRLLLSVNKPDFKSSKVFGIVSPHAGYIYSGKTAAFGFNLLGNQNIENVIIISPSHREYFSGSCIYSGAGYETPLGKIEINKELAKKITEGSKTIFENLRGHGKEHAIEVQLPFLQNVIKNFKIIPIVIGDQSKIYVDELANQIAKAIDDKSIIIASSDLSHFHSRVTADRLDSIVEDSIEKFEYLKLQENLEKGICEACGGGPIVAMMKTADILKQNKSRVLHRSDSGDVTGDFNEVVGYLSAVVYGD